MKGTVCIITGAGSGIGRSAAIKLAALGASVVLVGRTASKLDAVVREIEAAGGVAVAAPCDVSDFAAVRQVAETTYQRFGRIDVLVNNAGGNTPNRTTLTITPQEAEEVVRVHFLAPVFFTQAVLPAMLRAERGTIINVSSRGATHPGALGGPAYCGAKAAVVNFTQYLNGELKNTGVRACCVLPGETDTPMLELRPVVPDAEARKTMMSPDDVADAIVLAASLPQRALMDEVHIRPTILRDYSKEVPAPPRTGDNSPGG